MKFFHSLIFPSFPDQKPGEIEENEEETFTDDQKDVVTKINRDLVLFMNVLFLNEGS